MDLRINRFHSYRLLVWHHPGILPCMEIQATMLRRVLKATKACGKLRNVSTRGTSCFFETQGQKPCSDECEFDLAESSDQSRAFIVPADGGQLFTIICECIFI